MKSSHRSPSIFRGLNSDAWVGSVLIALSFSVGLGLVACMKVGDGVGVTDNGSPRIDPCIAAPTAKGCPQDPCVLAPTSKGCPQDPCVLNPQAEGCVIVVDSCTLPNPPARCNTPKGPSFAATVQPILTDYCVTCHQPTGTAYPLTKLSFKPDTAYGSLVNQPSEMLKTVKKLMLRVKPGSLDSSFLYIKLTKDVPPIGVKMPATGTIPKEKVTIIKEWIEGGALP